MSQLDIHFDITAGRHGDNPESAAAHESIVSSKRTMQRQIVEWIRVHGGATCEEVEHALDLKHQTASARLSELRAEGRLVRDGRRQTSSGRWAAVLKVRDEKA